jgi:two-component system cell cycle response regulator DivK
VKILAVDDNPTNLEIIKVLLRAYGYPVLEAASGEAAVGQAKLEKPDLIFMDLTMPGEIDGLEATRRIKADPETRHIVIVAVTAMVTLGDESQAREAGCDAFIRKPYTRKELLSLIHVHFPQANAQFLASAPRALHFRP